MPAIVPQPRPPTVMSWASSPAVRRTMQANRRRDTSPELELRRLLHGWGLRYRVDWPLPINRRRRADIAFPGAQLVVFVDGCFWHRCESHYVPPRSNAQFWEAKTSGNRRRDLDTDLKLLTAGWISLRFWEHVESRTAAEAIRVTYEARRLWADS